MATQELLLAVVVIAVYWMGRSRLKSMVRAYGKDKQVPQVRVRYVETVLAVIWALLAIILVGTITGFGVGDFGLFFTSIFAVLGVAFFAQWSILSNITASIIVFFFFPYRVGDKVKIHDGDYIEGIIEEITLFHVILKSSRGKIVTYPNSMVFQKAVSITKPVAFEDEIDASKLDEKVAVSHER